MFRPGVLVNLSLPATRIGDEGARALAPALAGIRSVDLRCNNIGDTGTTAIASALSDAVAAAAGKKEVTVAVSSGDEGTLLTGRRTKRLCILERLSLAGNRIEDAGVAALSEMLVKAEKDENEEQDGKMSVYNDGQYGERHASAVAVSAEPAVAAAVASSSVTLPASPPPPEEMFRFLGWLSVAGNPGISDDARQRLLRAGSNRRVLRGSGGGENDPPTMAIIA